jgi:hypothetical protein
VSVPPKQRWKATASSGSPWLAIDDHYATAWIADPSPKPWLEIDLGESATLGGLEVYWGNRAAAGAYAFQSSPDGKAWSHLCGTRHGEGGQDVFAFPPASARLVRWTYDNPEPERGQEIVEINLYDPADAASVREEGRIAALGHGPIKIPLGESITVDFGYVRSPLGLLVEWGETYATVFSVDLSDDGKTFRKAGHMNTGDGGVDNFWWPSTSSRYLRLTVHAANSPEGAVINELKLRIQNKDRMPIGQLERAAMAGPRQLYPQALVGRQVYWTALGEFDQGQQALFDEYGNLEPQRGSPQLAPLLRVDGVLHGAPECADIHRSLVDGSLPIPSVTWSVLDIEVRITALAHHCQASVEYEITNRSRTTRAGALVLAVHPAQINPYWQHGGHAVINAIAAEDRQLWVNDRPYVVFSSKPAGVAIADFDGGDVVNLIENAPRQTDRQLRSNSGLLSAACEFPFSLDSEARIAFVVSSPMKDGVTPDADTPFDVMREAVAWKWRNKIGPRRIALGDREVSDTVEAQTALILVNATGLALKSGPRHYDRTWIRDGSSQALALLWAGLIEEAKDYVIWYAKRIYANGMVPPILNVDGSINRGYGSDIEFDAQGEFVGIAASVYRISRDCDFLKSIFEPVLRATRFIEVLRARTNVLYGPGTRFHGLLAPSISHEGYAKPSYSYWDDYFALSAWRNCEYLALELGETDIAAEVGAKGREFAGDLARSLRMTSKSLGTGLIHASADREDVDPSSTSIAFAPCRVEDILPAEFIQATYDLAARHLREITEPGFAGVFTPYILRNLNAFVSLGRFEDAFRLLSAARAWQRPGGWRHWAEVVWGVPSAPEYIGDMPHTWVGAEFATAIRRMLLRENGGTLELFRAVPDAWWNGEGISLNELPTTFGTANLRARRDHSRATIELSLTGPAPERITVRYPGARRAQVDGRPCHIDADVIVAPSFGLLLIDF